MSYKFTKTLTKVVFGIALACYIAAAYIMNRGGNAVAMLAQLPCWLWPVRCSL